MADIKRKELEITISPDGESVTVHTKGTKGKQCIDATTFLEEGLGVVEERTYTPEYHQQPEKEVVNIGLTKGN